MVQTKSNQVNEQIFTILFEQDEVTWQSIIYDLVNEEGMDPWDINVSVLASRFLGMLSKLKNIDFRVSGKMILAAAFLLKMKSTRLLGEDIDALDELMRGAPENEFMDSLPAVEEVSAVMSAEHPRLIPRTPQPRKRRVSVFDLVAALEKALAVEDRKRIAYIPQTQMHAPEKKPDISVVMKDVYAKVKKHYDSNSGTLSFTQIIPSETAGDKIMTFIPLLHLENQQSISMDQKVHFGDIWILLEQRTKDNKDGLPE